ncbi:general substrate transporter [Dactylonectria macrodidyma]|uniref:General substrate transporter n=1 Tax=Dactylonectria macrodidyma TaxID=307937 RepID=A0A9P9JNM5_9HYPO|nr:general substrate transporter [Dactylonectria macrodidyma]
MNTKQTNPIQPSDTQVISAGEKVEECYIEAAVEKLIEVDINTLSREALTWKSKATFRLALVILVQGLSVAAFAIDGNIIGGMASLPAFRDHFDVNTSGSRIAIVLAAMSIGNAVASLFQWLSDVIGRRGTAFLGNCILIIGCVLQAAAPNHAALVVGRLISGAGCSLSATVGPLYMSEVAPSAYRGLAVGLYCSLYSIGAIIIAVVLLGGSYLSGDWSWRMPMIFQLGPPVIVAALIYPLTPESPRYLVYKGKIDKARQVIAKYHTSSERLDDPIVVATVKQIQDSIETVDAKAWDFTTLWSTKDARYRLFIIFIYSFYQQCNGTGMLNYYLPRILELVGITNTQDQLAVNIGMTVASWISTVVGATIIDRVTRRFLLLATLAIFIFFLALMSVAGGLFASGIEQRAMGIWSIALVYLFQVSNGLFAAALHNIYPNEVLSISQRAKGMGMYSFFQNVFGFAMTYGVGELLMRITWKIYFMFIGTNIICMALTWKFFPEFRFLSLEEIDYIFESPEVHPVKMSKRLQKTRLQQRREERERQARA